MVFGEAQAALTDAGERAQKYKSKVGFVPRAGKALAYYSPVKNCSILYHPPASEFNYNAIFRSNIILQVSCCVEHGQHDRVAE